MKINDCFSCKWVKQYDTCVKCSHKNKLMYIDIKEKCPHCDRLPKIKANGCGACIGRGSYAYPGAYSECDCDGFEANSTELRKQHELQTL